jgi:hypothetical protein
VTAALLIVACVVIVGLLLILAANDLERSRRKYKQLATQNLRQRQLIRDVEVETNAQLGAGNATFEQTRALITEYREKEAA